MRRLVPSATLVVALLAVVVGCGDGGDDQSAGAPSPAAPATADLEYEGSAEGFYDVPQPLPKGVHGDLVRYQRLEGADVAADVYRVMYLSESVPGERIAVTGVVAVPHAPAATGGRPVLSWAHGTVGIADRCAPSKAPVADALRRAAPLLDRGWVIAATDYEGLGTPGRHPYIAGISEGRGTLDAVRAARQLPGVDTAATTLVWGHSQGGHAALFAAELAAAWTPELDVVGTVAGAPPSELPMIAAVLRDGPYAGYLALAAAGLNAAYPEASLESVLTPQAIERLDVVDEVCAGEVHDVFRTVPYDDFVATDFNTVPAWREVLEENNPGTTPVDHPMLIIHGEADEQIPPVASALLFERLCGLGQVVERRTYPGAGHAEVIGPSFGPMVEWMEARLAGEPAPSGCG